MNFLGRCLYTKRGDFSIMFENIKNKILNNFESKVLIWDAVYSDQDFNNMLAYSREIIKRVLNGDSRTLLKFEHKVIFATLVEIARRKNLSEIDETNDKGFWDSVFYYLEINNTSKAYGLLTDSIKSLPITKATNQKKYYGTILMYALAPQRSLFSFFDLCYKLYKSDLEFNFTQEDKSFIEYCGMRLADIINQGRVGENDDISIGSNVYFIKIGIRQMAINMNDQLINIIERTINGINNLFHNIAFNNEASGYLEEKIKDWWQQKCNLVILDQKDFKKHMRAISQENIAATYVLENNEAHLVMPSIRLKEDSNTFIELHVPGEEPIIKQLTTRKNEFTTTTLPVKFKLNEVLKEEKSIILNVRVLNNEQPIYDSHEKLNRQFILFGAETEISKSLNEPTNYYFYTRDSSLLEQVKQKNMLKSQLAENLYNIYPKTGDTINGKSRTIIFAEYGKNKINPNIELIGSIIDVEWIKDDNHFKVYNNAPKLLVSRKISLHGIEIRINSSRIVLTGILDMIEDEANNCYVFNLERFICNEQPCHFSVYSNSDESELFREYLLLFKDISINFSNTILIADESNFVECKYEGNYLKRDFGIEKEELFMDFKGGELLIILPWIKWRIDNGQWTKASKKTPMWYENVLPSNGSILELEVPNSCSINDMKVFCISQENRNINGLKELDGKNGKFDLGRFIYSVGEYNTIKLLISYQGKEHILMTISTKEHFLNHPLGYSEDLLYWSPQGNFIGNDDCRFAVKLYNESDTFRFDNLSSTNEVIDVKQIQKNIYHLLITMYNSNSLLHQGKTVYTGDFILGIKEQLLFKNKEIIIQEIYCGYETSESNMEFKELIPTYFIDDLEYFHQDDRGYYLGRLGVYLIDGQKKYLNSMRNALEIHEKVNPVRVELITDEIIEVIAGYDVNNPDDFLGQLFYNKKTKFIDNQENKSYSKCINAYKIKIRRKGYV